MSYKYLSVWSWKFRRRRWSGKWFAIIYLHFDRQQCTHVCRLWPMRKWRSWQQAICTEASNKLLEYIFSVHEIKINWIKTKRRTYNFPHRDTNTYTHTPQFELNMVLVSKTRAVLKLKPVPNDYLNSRIGFSLYTWFFCSACKPITIDQFERTKRNIKNRTKPNQIEEKNCKNHIIEV